MFSPHIKSLRTRRLSDSNVFIVVFSIIAFVVVVLSLVCAYTWPKIRFRWWRKRLSSINCMKDAGAMNDSVELQCQRGEHRRKPRQDLSPQLYSNLFPSHPAVLHRSEFQLNTAALHVYDPRYESPFVNHPVSSSTGNTGALRHRAQSVLAAGEETDDHVSLQSFRVHKSSARCPGRGSATLMHTSTKYDKSKSIASDGKFGDAREYILAIPEPLLLRNRSPMPSDRPRLTASEISEDIARTPRATFRSQRPNPIHGHRSRTKLWYDNTAENDQVSENECSISYISEVSTFADRDEHQNFRIRSVSAPATIEDTTSVADVSVSDDENFEFTQRNKSITALHRLRSYRSLTGAQPPLPLTRAGTLTRPKTPVAEIRDRFDKAASDVKGDLKRTGTVSTGLTTTTSQTSKTASTPCTPFTNDSSMPVSKVTAHGTAETTPSKHAYPARRHIERESTFFESKPRVLKQDRRPPRPQALNASLRWSPRPGWHFPSQIPVFSRKSKNVRPVTSKSSLLTPLIPVEYNRSSSLYSRNTRAFSIVRSPVMTSTIVGQSIPTSSPALNHYLHGSPAKLSTTSSNSDERSIPFMLSTDEERTSNVVSEPSHWHPANNSHLEKDPARDVFVSEEKCGSARVRESESAISAISSEMSMTEIEAARLSIPRMCVRESHCEVKDQVADIHAIPIGRSIDGGRIARQAETEATTELACQRYIAGDTQWL